jgi:5-oxoprolinase (ATP-hydrolysing)
MSGVPGPDPMLLEVFHQRFMAIAEQMGEQLRKTARSVNIKERLDFSCAVFDAAGGLVANAPHIPVHLGAMGETVRVVVERRRGRLRPGDAILANDPAAGGSHLPDLTVVTPVFLDDAAATPDFVVACRGHHADVGGITPGSMPPFSRSLAEEGVVFSDFLLADGGRLCEAELREALGAGPHPARAIDDNVADLIAQLAANEAGIAGLRGLAAEFGADVVAAYMQHIQVNAADAVRALLRDRLPGGGREFVDHLDGGARIACAIEPTDAGAIIDFAGTSPAGPDNLNAPRAVAVAAVLYVLRALLERPIPLNAGCLAPIDLRIPRGSLLDPPPGSAVAGGNVETSQRVVDVLLGAFGAAAASQGTMNNLTFGNADCRHYETIAGGAGATPTAPGASGVHTHMTNTRITDPEILERRFPVRLHRFALRPDSGGSGRHPGGAGVIREIEFLAPMTVSLVSQRRAVPPFGLAGGEPGERGTATHTRAADGRVTHLPGACGLDAAPGDRLTIHTPGGGGYGP